MTHFHHFFFRNRADVGVHQIPAERKPMRRFPSLHCDHEPVGQRSRIHTDDTFFKDKGVETVHMFGQVYDGAENMSGRLNGVQAIFQQEHAAALYVHCASHSLNLALCHSCSIPGIRNAFGVLQEVCKFY